MISIVIPIYNEEKHISRCLESLKAQDYRGGYEIIVIDNASTDCGPQVAREAGAKVIFCRQRGTVYAREAGFRAACGEIVVQGDGDTIYPVDWLSRIVQHFSSHPEVVAVAGEVHYLDAPLWARPLQFFRRLLSTLSFRLLGKPTFCLACNFTFRREALVKAGGYNIGLPFVGDEQDLLNRLGKVGKVIYDARLLAETSSRRFCGRFWQFYFGDMFYGTILEQIWFRLTGRSLAHNRACPREEPMPWHARRHRWAWALGAAAVIIGFLSYSYFTPTSQVFGQTYDRIASSQKTVALTFDDGPNEPYTSQILDILDSYGVKATFFAIGQNVEYYPDVARRIIAKGHILGNHSYTHRAFAEFDIPDYSELDRAQDAIYRITGVKPHLFRPPYGRKTPWELDYVRNKGLAVVTWSDSANDPHRTPPESIETRILQRVRPGAIILLHDGNMTKHGSDQSRTVAALPKIIETLREQGYTFVTVPELLNVPPYMK